MTGESKGRWVWVKYTDEIIIIIVIEDSRVIKVHLVGFICGIKEYYLFGIIIF